MESKNEIQQLYLKFLAKTASTSEVHRLLDWIEKTDNAEEVLQQMEVRWNHSDHDKEYPGDWQEVVSRLKEVNREVSGTTLQNLRLKRRRFLQYAAGLALFVFSSILLWQHFYTSATLSYATGNGETKTILLPDGSEVRLNANSQIVWLNKWKKRGIRQIQLTGEAFFDVSHQLNDDNEKYPFQVITEDLTIRVLGTTFNVNNRRDKTDVFLETGKVELTFTESQREDEAMQPGEMVSFSKKSAEYAKKETSVVKSASWTEGSFIYDSEKLQNIISEIEDIYGKHVSVEDSSILDKRYTIGLPYTNWDMVVESLALMMDLTIEKKEDGIIIKK